MNSLIEIHLNIEKYEGDEFEDLDKPPFVNSNEFLHMARELEYESDYGTADVIMRALVFANGNIGLAKQIRFKEDHDRNYKPV